MAIVPTLRSSRRRTGALLTSAVVAAAGLTFVPGAPASAAEHDEAPAAAGADWLAAQLDDGLVVGAWGVDRGLSADIAFALDEVGGHEATVAEISNALEADVTAWHSEWDSVNAGAVAKSLLLAQVSGANPRDFGGVDLIETLEGRIADSGPTQGRLRNQDSDWASVFSQAFAVQGLGALAEPSSETDDATAFLLKQQCAEGWFRQTMAPENDEEQTCDGAATASPSTDVTAFAVLALRSQDVVPATAAVERAASWLLAQQRSDGSFGATTGGASPNANSTGLAARALFAAGEVAAAKRAAVWLRAHQLTNVGACQRFSVADAGAIAYNDDGVADAAKTPLTMTTVDQYRRATAQALPALQYAPAAAGAPSLTGRSGYVPAGRSQVLRATGLAPGETACVSGPKAAKAVTATDAGAATASVTLPAGTGNRTYRVTGSAGSDTVTFRALGATRPGLRIADRIRKGKRTTVKVTGLARREKVTISLRGRRVSSGYTNARGVFETRFRVTGRVGRAKVEVVGQFANRDRVKVVRVVR